MHPPVGAWSHHNYLKYICLTKSVSRFWNPSFASWTPFFTYTCSNTFAQTKQPRSFRQKRGASSGGGGPGIEKVIWTGIGVPLIIRFRLGFSSINHPFWGTPNLRNTHIIYIMNIYTYMHIYIWTGGVITSDITGDIYIYIWWYELVCTPKYFCWYTVITPY